MSKIKWNYVFGAVTITAIIGGTIYVIVKAKQAEALEEESISVDEAREIAKQRTFEKGEETVIFHSDINYVKDVPEPVNEEGLTEDEIAEIKDEVRSIQAVPYYDIPREDDHLDEEEETDLLDGPDPEELQDGYPQVYDDIPGPTIEPLNGFSYYEENINAKEDKELRYPKDSEEAKHQYIRMELADLELMGPPYAILLELFDFPFVPMNKGDEMLKGQLIDYRVQFFGLGSKWNREVSYSDVILHYARCAQFNCDESISYWVDHFLEYSDFEPNMSSHEIDTLLMRLNSHTYFNESAQTFGLFGLDRQSMDEAIRVASRSLYRQVTYETEFQEFLKSNL